MPFWTRAGVGVQLRVIANESEPNPSPPTDGRRQSQTSAASARGCPPCKGATLMADRSWPMSGACPHSARTAIQHPNAAETAATTLPTGDLTGADTDPTSGTRSPIHCTQPRLRTHRRTPSTGVSSSIEPEPPRPPATAESASLLAPKSVLTTLQPSTDRLLHRACGASPSERQRAVGDGASTFAGPSLQASPRPRARS